MSGLAPKGFKLLNYFNLIYKRNQPIVTTAINNFEDELAKWRVSNLKLITAGSRSQTIFPYGTLQCDLNEDSGGGGSAQIQFQESDDNGVTDSWSDFGWSQSGTSIPPAFRSVADQEFHISRDSTPSVDTEIWFRLSINRAGTATSAQFKNILLNLAILIPDEAILTRIL